MHPNSDGVSGRQEMGLTIILEKTYPRYFLFELGVGRYKCVLPIVLLFISRQMQAAT